MKAFGKAIQGHHGLMDIAKKTAKNYYGSGIDIHKAIGKLQKPKRGFTLPGHNYTGPYNPLDKQLKFDPKTGEILEIYQQPTGMTDAVSMQHDVDYSVCGDNRKCKNKADRKMVKALDKYRIMKDNGDTLLQEMQSQQRKNLVSVFQKTEKAVE